MLQSLRTYNIVRTYGADYIREGQGVYIAIAYTDREGVPYYYACKSSLIISFISGMGEGEVFQN